MNSIAAIYCNECGADCTAHWYSFSPGRGAICPACWGAKNKSEWTPQSTADYQRGYTAGKAAAEARAEQAERERDAVPASRNELRCEDCNSELVMVGWTAGGLDMTEPVESYDCPLCRAKADRAALHEAAWRLSTWSASINWDGRGNTQSWLEGLRERIEAVQAFGKPQTAPQPKPTQETPDHV